MIRIAYLISSFPSVSHTFILREILSLRDKGFDIKVCSINMPDIHPSSYTLEEKAEFRETYYIKSAGIIKALSSTLFTLLTHPIGVLKGIGFVLTLGGWDIKRKIYNIFYLVEAMIIGRWMKRNELSHLHIHFANPASTVGMILSKIYPFTISITVHGPDEFYEISTQYIAQKIRASSFICCIGYYARSQLMKFSDISQWNKFEITPLGIDPNQFIPQTFRSNPEIFELLCVGRLVMNKGQFILLSAIKILLEGRKNVRLRLIGDGPDRKQLQKKALDMGIDSNVIFEGAISQSKIREFYQNADLFLLPSFAEGIPVVLMEAMSTEICCISTFVNGIPELIRSGIDGILVAPSNEFELAKTIEYLLTHPSERVKLAKAGRTRVLEKYDLNKNIQLLANVFHKRLKTRVL